MTNELRNFRGNIEFLSVASCVHTENQHAHGELFSTSSDHYYAVSQRTRIYADPNVSVNLQNEVLTSGPEVINCSIVASGYLTP